jgi:hypothetical protein
MKAQTKSNQRSSLRPIKAIAAAGLLLTGCVVTSVYPWYNPKDVVFEPALVGTWVEANTTNAPKENVRFERAEGDGYTMTINGEKSVVHDAHLFKLKGQLYLDYTPREGHEDFIPPHYLLKVDRVAPTFQLRGLNHQWLAELVRTNTTAIRHVIVGSKSGDSKNSRVVLTADTAELQAFLRKHVADTNVFDEPTVLKHP